MVRACRLMRITDWTLAILGVFMMKKIVHLLYNKIHWWNVRCEIKIVYQISWKLGVHNLKHRLQFNKVYISYKHERRKFCYMQVSRFFPFIWLFASKTKLTHYNVFFSYMYNSILHCIHILANCLRTDMLFNYFDTFI